MGVTEEGIKVVADGLKGQPFALALIVVNFMFLAAAGWFLTKIGDRVTSRDAMIMSLVKDCAAK